MCSRAGPRTLPTVFALPHPQRTGELGPQWQGVSVACAGELWGWDPREYMPAVGLPQLSRNFPVPRVRCGWGKLAPRSLL